MFYIGFTRGAVGGAGFSGGNPWNMGCLFDGGVLGFLLGSPVFRSEAHGYWFVTRTRGHWRPDGEPRFAEAVRLVRGIRYCRDRGLLRIDWLPARAAVRARACVD